MKQKKVGTSMFILGIILAAVVGFVLFVSFLCGNESAFKLNAVKFVIMPLFVAFLGFVLATRRRISWRHR